MLGEENLGGDSYGAQKRKSTQTEQLEQWVNNAVVSLSASLVFGRDKASQISQPLLCSVYVDFK